MTAIVCGCVSRSIKNGASSSPVQLLLAIPIASAAAVGSSSIDAFEIESPVKSVITV
ncbi:unannotated protein [freshwater metagenome]|uniref:Unannotated protein n=1 Tax=freshwater metagenome TaxID=449393 RepID=A0A6J7ULK7_9ZZZZ